MPKNIEVPFAAQMGDAGATQNSREVLLNSYAEPAASGIKQIIRRQRPGLINDYALLGEKRCIEKNESVGGHYLIVGNTFYFWNGTALSTLGTIGTSTGVCTMTFNNNDEVLISDGAVLYWWNGSALAAVTVPAGFIPGTVAFIGGYGAVNDTSTNGRFYVTGADDFSTIDALDFATAESTHDPLIRVFADHNELWLFGTTSVEVWQLSGGTDFPLSPYSNAKLERGCGAIYSVASEDNTVFFLGEDFVVYRAEGYRPLRISTSAVEEQIRRLSAADKAACRAFVYTWRGSKFLTLTFGASLTVQYNMGTGLWNQANTFTLDYWRVVGSAGHGSSYYLTFAGISHLGKVNKDDGGIMRRGGVSAPGYAEGRRISIPEFYLDAEVGRAAAGITPNVMLRCALDGETFSNERVRTLGLQGEYRNRAVWRNLGQGRKPVIEIMVTDDFEFTVTVARTTVSVASS